MERPGMLAGERANDFVYSGTLRMPCAYVMLGRIVVRRVVLFVSYVLFVLCWSVPCSLVLCSVVVCWAVACLSPLRCGVVVLCCVVLRCVGCCSVLCCVVV